MSRLDVHGCIAIVREHFYRGDEYGTVYKLPVEAFVLNRELQYRLCEVWRRNQHQRRLSERECILLAESWYMAAPSHTAIMFRDVGWEPPCVHCGRSRFEHEDHPENNPQNDPSDRWLCADGQLYEPKQYPRREQ